MVGRRPAARGCRRTPADPTARERRNRWSRARIHDRGYSALRDPVRPRPGADCRGRGARPGAQGRRAIRKRGSRQQDTTRVCRHRGCACARSADGGGPAGPLLRQAPRRQRGLRSLADRHDDGLIARLEVWRGVAAHPVLPAPVRQARSAARCGSRRRHELPAAGRARRGHQLRSRRSAEPAAGSGPRRRCSSRGERLLQGHGDSAHQGTPVRRERQGRPDQPRDRQRNDGAEALAGRGSPREESPHQLERHQGRRDHRGRRRRAPSGARQRAARDDLLASRTISLQRHDDYDPHGRRCELGHQGRDDSCSRRIRTWRSQTCARWTMWSRARLRRNGCWCR
jgi:hypothetical protein